MLIVTDRKDEHPLGEDVDFLRPAFDPVVALLGISRLFILVSLLTATAFILAPESIQQKHF